MRVEAWSPSREGAFLAFWNRSFSGCRNFLPLTRERFRERILRGGVPGERFDPAGLVLALEGSAVVGFVHSGRRTSAASRVHDPSWPGGTRGLVYFLFVDPAKRRRGIGDRLWHLAVDRLRGTRQVSLDGTCLNPFYGNARVPAAPLWGSPEGPMVSWDDSATKKFLARKGFAPRFRAVHLSGTPTASASEPGIRFVRSRPVLGRAPGRAGKGGFVESAVSMPKGRIRGFLTYFPMGEVRPGLWAVHEAAVVDAERGGTLGARLLRAALGRLHHLGGKAVEVLTIPELSEHAHRVYLEAGFTPVDSWAVY
jgi:GNAT superfamily N-acetyltransferase